MLMSIDWGQVDKSIVAVAMNDDGAIHGYESVPKSGATSWMCGGKCYQIGIPWFPFSALLSAYHPKDWEDSLTLRPVRYTKAQYEAMAARRQFGVFWDGEGEMDIGAFGRLIAFSNSDRPRFSRKQGAWWDNFLPLRPLQPIPPEEIPDA